MARKGADRWLEGDIGIFSWTRTLDNPPDNFSGGENLPGEGRYEQNPMGGGRGRETDPSSFSS